MVEHVYKRSALCRSLDVLAVATPDDEIARAVRAFGGDVVMTSPAHHRATDRVAEASKVTGGDIVIVIQGDEPLLRPEMIEAAVKPVLEDAAVFCSNLVERIPTLEEFQNPNTIKVTMDGYGNALYFSREPIPSGHRYPFDQIPAYKQVCILPFRRENLLKFTKLEPTILEQVESIDMLRILEHGHTVRLVNSGFRTLSVDVPEDILSVEALMEKDPTSCLY
jgi:3-deoxy-manno-octulosonate cytidylyltransferase (CMP-KDO synthetase)